MTLRRTSRSGRSVWTIRRCGCAYWRHARRKLCRHQAIRIRSQRGFGKRATVIAAEHGITTSNVYKITTRASWRDT